MGLASFDSRILRFTIFFRESELARPKILFPLHKN